MITIKKENKEIVLNISEEFYKCSDRDLSHFLTQTQELLFIIKNMQRSRKIQKKEGLHA